MAGTPGPKTAIFANYVRVRSLLFLGVLNEAFTISPFDPPNGPPPHFQRETSTRAELILGSQVPAVKLKLHSARGRTRNAHRPQRLPRLEPARFPCPGGRPVFATTDRRGTTPIRSRATAKHRAFSSSTFVCDEPLMLRTLNGCTEHQTHVLHLGLRHDLEWVAITALTSFSTTTAWYMRQHAMYSPWR